MTSIETAPQGEKRVISRVRFTSELCGYGDIGHVDIKQLQGDLASDLEKFFKGRVPVGNKFPRVGVLVRDSRDPQVGTACTGDIMVYLGVEGEDLERACNQCLEDPEFKKRHPITWWEMVTDETQKARDDEKARRKEYSKGLMSTVTEKISANKAAAKERFPGMAAPSTPATFQPDDDGVDPDDLF